MTSELSLTCRDSLQNVHLTLRGVYSITIDKSPSDNNAYKINLWVWPQRPNFNYLHFLGRKKKELSATLNFYRHFYNSTPPGVM